jgi:hypothetical protein
MEKCRKSSAREDARAHEENNFKDVLRTFPQTHSMTCLTYSTCFTPLVRQLVCARTYKTMKLFRSDARTLMYQPSSLGSRKFDKHAMQRPPLRIGQIRKEDEHILIDRVARKLPRWKPGAKQNRMVDPGKLGSVFHSHLSHDHLPSFKMDHQEDR